MYSSSISSRSAAWAIWIIASLFYMYQFILRVMPSVMLKDIMQHFQIDALTFGQFSGIYYIGYSLMHLPIGILLDHYGPRKVISGCILLTVIGLTPLIYADYWLYPVIGRLLVGMGSSAAILGVFKIIRMTFTEKLFPRMLSFSVTIGLIGAIYGGAPLAYMREVVGYAVVIELLIVMGILLALITYLMIPHIDNDSNQTTVLSEIKEVLTNGRVIWTCLFAGLMVGPLEGFADVWGTVFFKEVYGFTGALSASLPSMIFVGMCLGAPVLSILADWIGSYLLTIIGAGIVMTLSFLLLLTLPLTSIAITCSFIIVGVCSAYQILAIYKASTYVRPQVIGLTTAVANMIIMIFGYAFHTMIGVVINQMGGAHIPAALTFGIAIIPVGLCLGTLGFIVLFFYDRSINKKNQLEA